MNIAKIKITNYWAFFSAFIITLPWLGFSFGFLFQVNDFIKFSLSFINWFVIFPIIFFLFKKNYIEFIYVEIKNKFLIFVIYFLVSIYFFCGLILIYFFTQFDGNLGSYRMYVFNAANNIEGFSLFFVIINVIISPLIIILQIFNFKTISSFATISSFLVNFGFNSRFLLLISILLFFLRFKKYLNKMQIYLSFFLLFFILIYLFIERLDYDNLNTFDIIYNALVNIFDYSTISSGVYEEYLKSFNFGSFFPPFTFIDTIFSKLIFEKSIEGNIADISSNVLFYSDHNTGPFNAYFTFLVLFPSPDNYIFGMVYGFLALIFFLILNFYTKNNLFVIFNMIAIMLSGLMPYLFGLAWFFGLIWCFVIYRYSFRFLQSSH